MKIEGCFNNSTHTAQLPFHIMWCDTRNRIKRAFSNLLNYFSTFKRLQANISIRWEYSSALRVTWIENSMNIKFNWKCSIGCRCCILRTKTSTAVIAFVEREFCNEWQKCRREKGQFILVPISPMSTQKLVLSWRGQDATSITTQEDKRINFLSS